MKHELKIKPEYFAAVVSGHKTFEIRNTADRHFQVGDTLLLKEWDGEFTGQSIERVISYLTDFEQQPGYVVLGMQPEQRIPELTDDLRLILGRPNFSCIAIAEALRLAGHKIESKAEHEQAAVIHWLLGFYFSHGNQWIEAARTALKEMRDSFQLPPHQGGHHD